MRQKVAKKYLAETRFLFHCHVKIKLPLQYGETLLEDCFALMEHIDKQYNSWTPGSFFDQLNNRAGQWVDVDANTVSMLKTLQRLKELTKGAYNIASMPLLRCWGLDQYENSGDFPSAVKVEEVVRQLTAPAWEINGLRVRLTPGQELISGSFIKAFAVDRVLALLKGRGVTDAIINAGGSTIAALNDEEHPHWIVNVPHPRRPDQLLFPLRLSNACFSFSGRKINQPHGHILNARTGYPADNLQVGVLTKDCFTGDALSTALFALELSMQKTVGAQIAKEFPFRAYLITEDWPEVPVQYLNNSFFHFQFTELC